MTICQSMGKEMLGRLLFVVEWDYGTYGTHGTYGYGTMGRRDVWHGTMGLRLALTPKQQQVFCSSWLIRQSSNL